MFYELGSALMERLELAGKDLERRKITKQNLPRRKPISDEW